MKMPDKSLYFVFYRQGGTEMCQWHRVLECYSSHHEARPKAQEIEHMGYKTIIMSQEEIESQGIPIGWNPGDVDFEYDYIRVGWSGSTWVRNGGIRTKIPA